MTTARKPLFPLGRVLITANAKRTLPADETMQAIRRHNGGDWGNVDEEDREANEDALNEGDRLVSVYRTREGIKFYIITEADRSATTILLPEDY